MRAVDEAEFREYVSGHLVQLRRTAFLICGDWHQAEDIVQTALTKLYRSWRRIRQRGALDAYARQVVTRTCIDESRRGWQRERPTESLARTSAGGGGAATGVSDDRLVLQRALGQVPARQRAALVLRYWEDMSVADTAELLGCSEGTVKSSTARGLDSLRAVLVSQGIATTQMES